MGSPVLFLTGLIRNFELFSALTNNEVNIIVLRDWSWFYQKKGLKFVDKLDCRLQ